jgi:hypothetical protein
MLATYPAHILLDFVIHEAKSTRYGDAPCTAFSSLLFHLVSLLTFY